MGENRAAYALRSSRTEDAAGEKIVVQKCNYYWENEADMRWKG